MCFRERGRVDAATFISASDDKLGHTGAIKTHHLKERVPYRCIESSRKMAKLPGVLI